MGVLLAQRAKGRRLDDSTYEKLLAEGERLSYSWIQKCTPGMPKSDVIPGEAPPVAPPRPTVRPNEMPPLAPPRQVPFSMRDQIV